MATKQQLKAAADKIQSVMNAIDDVLNDPSVIAAIASSNVSKTNLSTAKTTLTGEKSSAHSAFLSAS